MLRVEVCTPRGRMLEYKETVRRIVLLDYNKSILSKNFNPSKFDFNPWDLDLHLENNEKDPKKTEKIIKKNPGGPTISFRLYTNQVFQVNKGDRLGCAAMIPTEGVPNWSDEDNKQQDYPKADVQRQRSML